MLCVWISGAGDISILVLQPPYHEACWLINRNTVIWQGSSEQLLPRVAGAILVFFLFNGDPCWNVHSSYPVLWFSSLKSLWHFHPYFVLTGVPLPFSPLSCCFLLFLTLLPIKIYVHYSHSSFMIYTHTSTYIYLNLKV